jgi:HTH-type transcriptional regulator/antitoxin HipB
MKPPARLSIFLPNQIGEIFRARRKVRRISQGDLAEKLGISQSRLSVLEANPAGLTLDRLLLLAKLLDLELVVQDRATTPTTKAEW